MYWKKANYVIVASLEPRPKQRYSENLAFVPTEPFLTRLVQSYTQQLVTTIGTRTLFYFFCLLFYSCILNFLPIIPILCPIILEIQSTFLHYNDNNNQSYELMIACYTVPSMMLRYSRSANSVAGSQKYCSE